MSQKENKLVEEQKKQWEMAFGITKLELTEEQKQWQRVMDGERERTEQEQNWIDAFKNY